MFRLFAGVLAFLSAVGMLLPQTVKQDRDRTSPPPTFYKDVLPIVQQHCQSCHRPSQIAPMSLVTYDETRRWATTIKEKVRLRKMPPWFADPHYGLFINDPSLTQTDIETLSSWADAKAPAGDPRESPPPRNWLDGWNIPEPDAVFQMPRPVRLAEHGDVDYTYEIVPTGFTEDMWVQMSELRPSSRQHVHHAVLYIRPPGSTWLQDAPLGVPFTAANLKGQHDHRDIRWVGSDLLLVYAPGSSPDRWPDALAKLVPAGSDLVFQMHYTTNGHAGSDQTSVGLVFAKQPPKHRVLTLQLTNDQFVIPPRVDDFRVSVVGTLPNDVTLLSFFPHMHVRGKRFEYNVIHPNGITEVLLRVNYDFFWQLSYKLAEPRLLKAGTKLQAVAWYDNTSNNVHNPDPDTAVTWGDQSYNEMMVGFFDVSVPKDLDKWDYFIPLAGATDGPTTDPKR